MSQLSARRKLGASITVVLTHELRLTWTDGTEERNELVLNETETDRLIAFIESQAGQRRARARQAAVADYMAERKAKAVGKQGDA